MAYGILLLGLAIFKATEFWRLNGFHGSQLVLVLIRDQAMYFVLCVSSQALHRSHPDLPFRAIVVAVFAIIGDEALFENEALSNIILTLGSTTFICILGSRMFLNLKEAAEHGVNVGTNWSSYSHSAILFDEPQGVEEL